MSRICERENDDVIHEKKSGFTMLVWSLKEILTPSKIKILHIRSLKPDSYIKATSICTSTAQYERNQCTGAHSQLVKQKSPALHLNWNLEANYVF